LVRVLFIFYIQDVLKYKKINPGAKRLTENKTLPCDGIIRPPAAVRSVTSNPPYKHNSANAIIVCTGYFLLRLMHHTNRTVASIMLLRKVKERKCNASGIIHHDNLTDKL